MKIVKKALVPFITITMLFATQASADIAVITHTSNTNDLNKTQISRIFLGKAKTFPNSEKSIPMSIKGGSDVHKEFAKKVLGKSSSQLKAYWAKLVFTGKGTPPKQINSDAEMIKLVAANPNLIGFVNAASVDDSVKVAATF